MTSVSGRDNPRRYTPPMPAIVLTCACPDAEVAQRLAHELVEARLAACVQVLAGMTSVYRWEGAIERAGEVLLLAKTWDDRSDDAISLLRSRHPYALPEIMALPAAGGLAAYLDWVHAQTRPTGAPESPE
jgi:periplasmic divalent cation tolerance protein